MSEEFINGLRMQRAFCTLVCVSCLLWGAKHFTFSICSRAAFTLAIHLLLLCRLALSAKRGPSNKQVGQTHPHFFLSALVMSALNKWRAYMPSCMPSDFITLRPPTETIQPTCHCALYFQTKCLYVGSQNCIIHPKVGNKINNVG